MAIRPEEVIKKVADEDSATLKRLEARIDAQIRDQFDGTSAVSVDLRSDGPKLRPAVKERLKQIYREAGWSASIDEGDCQRDGAWCYLKLSPSRRRPEPPSVDFRDQHAPGPYQ